MREPERKIVPTEPPAGEVFLKDALAESLARYAEQLPQAAELLAAVGEDGAGSETSTEERAPIRRAIPSES